MDENFRFRLSALSKLTLISIKQYFGLDQTADIQVNVKGFDHVGFYFIFFFFSQHHIFAGAPYSSICPAETCCPFDYTVYADDSVDANDAFVSFYVGNSTVTTPPGDNKTGLILGLSLGLGVPFLVISIVVLTCIFGRRQKRAQYKQLPD
jgi:hypothetical protein